MIRRILPSLPLLIVALPLASCGETPPPKPVSQAAPPKPVVLHEAGLDRVIGHSAPDLVALFGPADLDGHEGPARRMQFVGPACVLDAYLYPSKTGAEPTVSYVDARLPSGEDLDRASCIAALSRRAAAP